MTEIPWADLKNWFSSVAGAILVGLFWRALGYFRELVESVNTLNTKIAVIVETLKNHNDRINGQDARISRLEDRG